MQKHQANELRMQNVIVSNNNNNNDNDGEEKADKAEPLESVQIATTNDDADVSMEQGK